MTINAPVVAVHQVALYEVECHSCGWVSGLMTDWREADDVKDEHECETRQ